MIAPRVLRQATCFLLSVSAVLAFAPLSIERCIGSRNLVSCQASSQADDNFFVQKLAVSALVALSLVAGPGPALADGKVSLHESLREPSKWLSKCPIVLSQLSLSTLECKRTNQDFQVATH